MTAKVEPLQTNNHHFSSLAPISYFIQSNTGYQPTTMAEFQLLLGLVIGFQMIIRMGVDKLRRMIYIMSKVRNPDPKQIWLNDLKQIKTDFFQDMIHRVDRILIKFDDVLAYCHSVTVSQFSLQFGDDLRPEVIREMAKWVDIDSLPPGTFKEAEQDEDFKAYLKQKEEEERKKQQLKEEEDKRNLKLVNFDEIDKKIEQIFGLKMGEFLKDDEEILKSQIKGDQSLIKPKQIDSKDDSAFKDIADDLRSGKSKSKTGRSGNSKNILPSKTPSKPPSKTPSKTNQSIPKSSNQKSKASIADQSSSKNQKQSSRNSKSPPVSKSKKSNTGNSDN